MAHVWGVPLAAASIAATMAITGAAFYRHLVLVPVDAAVCWPVQRVHLRVILAAPLLAVLASVALLIPRLSVAADVVLAAYEGYCLFLFLGLLVLHLGGQADAIGYLERNAREHPLQWRICVLCKNGPVVRSFGDDAAGMLQAFFGAVVQYAVVKPVLFGILAVAIEMTRPEVAEHEETPQSLRALQTTARALAIVSLVLALWALMLAYANFRAGLSDLPAIASKFLAIKLLVFLVTVQRLALALAFDEFPADPLELESPAEEAYFGLLLLEAPLYALLLAKLFDAPDYPAALSRKASGDLEAAYSASRAAPPSPSPSTPALEASQLTAGQRAVRATRRPPWALCGAADVLRLHRVFLLVPDDRHHADGGGELWARAGDGGVSGHAGGECSESEDFGMRGSAGLVNDNL